MKRIIVSLLLISAFTATSCDDWLKTRSDLNIPVDDQFKSLSGFKDALSGIYAGLARTSLYSRNLTWGMADMMGQYYVTHEYDGSNENFPEAMAFAYDYDDSGVERVIDDVWRNAYNVIANINLMLENLEKRKDELHDLGYRLVKGEALAIRAMLHFDLMRYFGYGNWAARTDLDSRVTIPYSTSFSPEIVPQRSYTATFKLLTDDIDEAVRLLESSPVKAEWTEEYKAELKQMGESNTKGGLTQPTGFLFLNPNRMDYYGARALQARMYMWEGGEASKTKAHEAATECIEFMLSGGIFIWDEDFIFARQPQWRTERSLMGALENNDYLGLSESLMALHVTGFKSKLGNVFELSGIGFQEWTSLYLSMDMARSMYEYGRYGERDLRFSRLMRVQGYFNDVMTPLKLYNTEDGINMIHLVKIPEMYYIAAECLATRADSDIAGAIALLDEVRLNRGVDTSVADVMPEQNAESFMEELRKEYLKEFMCEGQMFLFYKRLGYENIDNYYQTMDDKKYMLPYPDDEVIFGNRIN